MSEKVSRKSVLFLVCVMILLPDISLAFNEEVRCQIFKDAVSLCPKTLRSYLTKNYAEVHSGLHFLDRSRRRLSSLQPDDTKILYEKLVKDLRQGKANDQNTTYRFGLLACFISETISPMNLRSRDSLVPKKVVYDGFHEVVNVDASVSGLVLKYRKPYGHSRDKRVTDFLYNIAVNQIVDHWISAWRAGGKDPGHLRPKGTKIAHINKLIHLRGKVGG